MGRLFGLLAIFGVGMVLTALLTVAWMLLLTYGKKKVSDMDSQAWDDYFRELPIWGYVARGLLFLALALWVSIPLVYGALRLFHYTNCGELSAFFGLVTVAAVVLRGIFKRNYLLGCFHRLKP